MLTRKLTSAVVVMFAAIFAGQMCLAQNLKSKATYSEPIELKFAAYEKLDLAELKDGEYNSGYLILEGFFPIGWSPDGKFAYLTEPADEACGCYFATLIIQDFRTDKILWKHEYEGAEGKDESIKTFWRANRAMFSRKLREYGIVQQKNFVLSKPVIESGGDVLTADLKTKETTGSQDFGIISDAVLNLTSKKKGKKTIYEIHHKPDGYTMPLGIELTGFLQSPFEPRGAFVLIEIHRGWEGPPNTTRLTLVGASLTNGFPK